MVGDQRMVLEQTTAACRDLYSALEGVELDQRGSVGEACFVPLVVQGVVLVAFLAVVGDPHPVLP